MLGHAVDLRCRDFDVPFFPSRERYLHYRPAGDGVGRGVLLGTPSRPRRHFIRGLDSRCSDARWHRSRRRPNGVHPAQPSLSALPWAADHGLRKCHRCCGSASVVGVPSRHASRVRAVQAGLVDARCRFGPSQEHHLLGNRREGRVLALPRRRSHRRGAGHGGGILGPEPGPVRFHQWSSPCIWRRCWTRRGG